MEPPAPAPSTAPACDWAACFAALGEDELRFYHQERCDQRLRVLFTAQYQQRVPEAFIPNPALTLCAPAACSEDAVARFVAPRFGVLNFDEHDVRTWPRVGEEVRARGRRGQGSGSETGRSALDPRCRKRWSS